MPFETKSNFDDKKEYFKNLVVINTSAILIILWVIVCGGLSSFYCVVSGADMINECLKNVSIDTSSTIDASASSVDASASSVDASASSVSDGSESNPVIKVPWHHEYNILGDDNKPKTAESSVWFNNKQRRAFVDTFFKKRADQYVKDVKEGADSFFFSKMWVQGISVFPRLVAHDLWFISEWHSFFQKLTGKLGWGTLLMTSFIGFPIFMGFFALFNAGAALWSWGESVIALYNQLYITKEVKEAVGTTNKDIDCSVQTIIKNLIILFFYVFIVPIIGLLTMIPTLAWLAMSLLIAPVYALCLPFKIQGFIIPTNVLPGETPDNMPKTKESQKSFDYVGVFLSNIYSYAGGYLMFFSVLYSIIAGIKQDVYSFIGCIVAVLIIFGGLKWYKSAAPDIEIPENASGGSQVPKTSESAQDIKTPEENAATLRQTPSDQSVDLVSTTDSQIGTSNPVTISGAETSAETSSETGAQTGADPSTIFGAGKGGAPRNKNKSSRKR